MVTEHATGCLPQDVLGVGWHPTNSKKETLVSFSKGHLQMSLRKITPIDNESGDSLNPLFRIVFLVDGRYVRMPLDPDLLHDFGYFLTDLSEALLGVDPPHEHLDVQNLRRMILESTS